MNFLDLMSPEARARAEKWKASLEGDQAKYGAFTDEELRHEVELFLRQMRTPARHAAGEPVYDAVFFQVLLPEMLERLAPTIVIPGTENFSLDEFKCHDGTEVPVELYPNCQKLMDNLEVLRAYIRKPIYIMSGYRSPEHNRLRGARSTSQHVQAAAADLQVDDLPPRKVHREIAFLIHKGQMHDGGLGSYPRFTHYDVRPERARWYK